MTSEYAQSQFDDDPNTPWYKVLNLIPSGSQVLDFGCSSGNFGEVLIKNKQCVVDGVELNPADAKIANSKLRKVYTKNIEQVDDFLEDKYDVIYFGDVIEHLVHPSEVLIKIKKHLNQNGVVVFSVPNMAHMSVRLMLLKGKFEYGETGLLDKTHLHFYDNEEIHRIFAEANFEVIKFDYVKRDIPRDVLIAELDKIGLKPDNNFLDQSKKIEASAYQFIGAAKPTNKVIVQKPRKSPSPPINEFEKHINYVKTVHAAQIEDHKKRIHELEIENEHLHKEINQSYNPVKILKKSALGKLIKKTIKKQSKKS